MTTYLLHHANWRVGRKQCEYCGEGYGWAHPIGEPFSGYTYCDDANCATNGNVAVHKVIPADRSGRLHGYYCASNRYRNPSYPTQLPIYSHMIDQNDVPEEADADDLADDDKPTDKPTVAVTIEDDGLEKAREALGLGADRLSKIIAKAVADASISPEKINAWVRDAVREVAAPTQVLVTNPPKPTTDLGVTHWRMPWLVKLLEANVNVWLTGPAASTKTHVALSAAESLGINAVAESVTGATSEYKFLGFVDAAGNYHRTAFRDKYEYGGVYVLDEIDNGSANALGVLNSALSNGVMTFPDGEVHRHPEFRCIATANTVGTGPDAKYVGRMPIDAATRDRFVVMHVGYDPQLEAAIYGVTTIRKASDARQLEIVANGDAERNAFAEFVWSIREANDEHRLPHVFGRSLQLGMKLLGVGLPMTDVVELAVRRGMSDGDWSRLTSTVKVPA